jgi:hypothetical protein
MTPKRGDILLHRHWITHDNAPLCCKITRIAQGVMYYRPYYGLHDDGTEWLGAPSYFPTEQWEKYMERKP